MEKPDNRKRLVALRHTAVHVTPGLCYGQIDIPLALSYPSDLRQVQQGMVQPGFTRVISSPLRRCHQLAHDLQLGPVHKDPRLMELSFGHWEGQLWSNIPREVSEYWTSDVVNRAPPGGESFRDLIRRVESLIYDPEIWSAGNSLLLVTHAGVIRALHHILEGSTHDVSLKQSISFGESRAWTL